eukprot:Gb_18461 [translate_table: standard]
MFVWFCMILIVAEYAGVKVDLSLNFQIFVSNNTPELKMNPISKVAVLDTADGLIFESNAIARYGENSIVNPFTFAQLKGDSSLCGFSLIDYAHIEQWIDFSITQIDIHLGQWILPRLGASYMFNRTLCALNAYLASHSCLDGHSVSLADIVMASTLLFGFLHLMTKEFTSEFPRVERYFWTMLNQPNFKKVLGEVKQINIVLRLPTSEKSTKPEEPAEKISEEESKNEESI